jgi:hypothetical protein
LIRDGSRLAFQRDARGFGRNQPLLPPEDESGPRWEWEVQVPELDTSVFLIPASEVKNREERLVVVNRVAKSVMDEMRDVHDEYAFAYKGGRVQEMNS